MALTVIFLTTTGAGTWTVPADWNSANNTIECIGGGGSGAVSRQANGVDTRATGGSGAAYASVQNLSLVPGSLVSYNVALGGASVSRTTNGTSSGNNGGDTWFGGTSLSTSSVGAVGGKGGTAVSGSNLTGAIGGQASSCVGSIKFSGGNSGSITLSGSGNVLSTGGGGAAGPNGNGNASADDNVHATGSSGGTGDAGSGGSGGWVGNPSGAGGNGSEWTATVGGTAGSGGGSGSSVSGLGNTYTANGGNYGAGSGGVACYNASGTVYSGAGAQGIIVITYDAITGVTVGLTGVAAAPAAGTLTGKGGARAAPAGVAANPAAGTLSVTLRIIVAPTGVAASPAAGNLVARGGARAAPAGVAASPAAGVPVATGGALLTLDGIAASPAAGVLKTFGVFDLTFIRSADHPGQYLIEITALQGGDTSSGGIETIGDGEIASFPIGAEVAGGLADLRYADRDWIGEPNDRFRANVFYDGRAVSPLIMEAMAPLYPEDERRVQRQFGLIDFINSDGEFDKLTKTLSIDGRGVTVRFGPYMGDYADFVVIASMLGTGWQAGEDKTSLAVQDQVYSLDLPIQPTFYGGTGGADGTADFIGKPKPLCYGAVFNVSPVFLDPLNLIYQVHDGAIKAIDAVKDRGGMLTLDTSVGTGGDVADYAALVAASVGVSKYATCKAQGMLKLGSSPAGVVTVDMRGDNTGGVYVDTIEGIAIRILETRTEIDMALVDTASFHDAVGSSSGAGLYISANDVPTTAQVISSLLGSLGGWWGAAIDGKIRAGRIRDPKTIDADKYLDTFDILNIEPEQKPIPRWRQRVSYAPNYTIQRGEDLDVTVTDTMRQTLAEPYSIVTASSSTLQVRHPMAFDPPVLVTQLADKTEAQAVADALQALFGVEREIIRISVKRIGMTINLGDCVNVTYPRFGLSNGKNFIVIGRSLDADRQETELRLWG